MSFIPPTDVEREAVQRLRVRIEESFRDEESSSSPSYKITDTAILRFYRGRKRDEVKAFRAISRHFQWRKDNDVDNISSKVHLFESEFKTGKIVLGGKDKDGHPAVFLMARKHDKNKRDLEQIRLLIIYMLETMLKTANTENERIVICFDLSGFTFACMDYELVKMLIDILAYNYPDTLHVALILNSPTIFWTCWMCIHPWLDPVTAAKAKFINSTQIVDYIDPLNMPNLDDA